MIDCEKTFRQSPEVIHGIKNIQTGPGAQMSSLNEIYYGNKTTQTAAKESSELVKLLEALKFQNTTFSMCLSEMYDSIGNLTGIGRGADKKADLDKHSGLINNLNIEMERFRGLTSELSYLVKELKNIAG